MSEREITDDLLNHVQSFLGKEGLDFFTQLLKEEGVVDPILSIDLGGGRKMPHPVHFREGMRVRNSMRESGLCGDWDSEDFDFYWTEVIEKIIERHDIQQAWSDHAENVDSE